MNETLTPEMKALIAELGALVKADPRCAEIEKTIDEYERNEGLNALVAEYNTCQDLLADAYNRPEDPGEDFKKSVQARIDALYDEITNHPAYMAYIDAKTEFDALTNEIFGELQFAITGKRPCSGNCSSCGSGGCAGCRS